MTDNLEEKPHYVGVCAGVGEWEDWFVVTAEYKDGYQVFGAYEKLEDAKRALPRIKRELKVKQ